MSLFVAPWPTTSLADLAERGHYEALLCSHGYETRSRAIAERLVGGPELTAIGFPYGHSEIYEENRRQLDAAGAELLELPDREFEAWVAAWFEQPRRRVAIDISSMSRFRIAATVHALRESANTDLLVDFLYVPQCYGPPPPIDTAAALEPVTDDFVGWYPDAARPLVILFGLGYEPVRAAGAIDELEPEMAIPYFPRGGDDDFVRDVEVANDSVLKLASVEDERPYDLTDPFSCLAELDSLVSYYGDSGDARPLFLPLGPKIFALICILVAAMRDPATPVWRVSTGIHDQPVDRQPEDLLVTLQVSPGPIEPRPEGD